MRIFNLFLLAGALLAPLARASAQRPVEVAPNAPADKTIDVTNCQWRAMDRAIAPLVAEARATYPAARDRFLAGLPSHHTFFVTTRLHDAAGHIEQVFIAVDSIAGSTIAGRIWSQIGVVRGFRGGQPYSFPDSELIDWMVARPDGSEEGNVVGKFMDSYEPPAKCVEPAQG
jgi:hypothetical protein